METTAETFELPLLHEARLSPAMNASSHEQTRAAKLEDRGVEEENNTDKIPAAKGSSHEHTRRPIMAWQAAGRVASFARKTTSVWTPEIASCVIAIIALLLIVIMLERYEGKPIPKWPKEISVNALVSILSLLLKTMLLMPVVEGMHELKWLWYNSPHSLADFARFESAAAGPSGAVMFLISLRRVRSMIGILGAAIIILSPSVDPFIQQMLHYHDCLEVSDAGQATVSRASNYSEGGFHTGAGGATLDAAMQSVIYKAAISPSPNATSDVTFDYFSGNGTFPQDKLTGVAYSSLGFCSSVTDISDQILDSKGGISNATALKVLPSGLNISDDGTTLLQMKSVYPEEHASVDTPLWSAEIVMFTLCPNATILNGIAQNCEGSNSSAFKVSLFPCVRQYANVSISNFVLQETIIQTLPVPMMNFSCDRIGPCGSLIGNLSALPNITCEPTQNPTSINTIQTSEYWPGSPQWSPALPNGSNVLYYPESCVWYIDGAATGAITQFLPTLFGFRDAPLSVGNFYGSTSYSTFGPIWLQRLYASGTADLTSVSLFMDDIAYAMTAQIRRHTGASDGDSSSQYAIGSVYISQTCISVRWEWLILPATLLVMALVFFVTVMFKSHRGRGENHELDREVWKSSPMPLIWTGLEDSVKTEALGSTASAIDDMTKAAGKLAVRLTRGGEEEGDEVRNRIVLRPL